MLTSMFNLELSRPWYLAALLILPAIYYFYRRSLVDFPRAQRRVSMIVRSLILVLIVPVHIAVAWIYGYRWIFSQ